MIKIELYELIMFSVLSLSMLYLVVCFLNNFLENRRNGHNVSKWSVYGIFFVIKMVLFLFTLPSWMNVMVTFLAVAVLTSLYHSTIKHKIAGILLILLLSMGSEVIVLYGYSGIIDKTIIETSNSQNTFLLMNSISHLVLLILVKIYQLVIRNKAKRSNRNYLNLRMYVQISVIPVMTIIMIHLLHSNMIAVDGHTVVKITLLLLAMNIIYYYLYEKLLISADAEADRSVLQNQMTYYGNQYELMKQNIDDVRRIRHDLKHQLIYIKAKLQSSPETVMIQLENEITELIGKVDHNSFIAYTNNFSFDVMLNYKRNVAKEKQIFMEIISEVNAKQLKDENKILTILGNLLDNAIESYNDEKSEQKQVIVKIYEETHNFYIKISNPYAHQLKKSGTTFLTTKECDELHGFGLKSVKKLVEELNGHLRMNQIDYIFTVEIVLFNVMD